MQQEPKTHLNVGGPNGWTTACGIESHSFVDSADRDEVDCERCIVAMRNRPPHREIVILDPTPENIERARFMDQNRYKIDSDSRHRRGNHFKPIYYLKRQDRFFVNMYLGHWRRFVLGVKVMTEDGEPTICFGLVLGETEMKRSK